MIEFSNVTKLYRLNSTPALDAINIKVERGEFVFLVGSSGSGKSTLLSIILREEIITKGQVLVLGKDVSKLSNRRVPIFRRQIGAVFQDFKLLENSTVYENVAFAMQVIGKKKHNIKIAVPEILEVVGLSNMANRLPSELSGGEQQRVAIARAAINRPPLLLADEPTGNLDPATSTEIMEALQRVNNLGTTILMATHDVTMVDKLQKRVIELDKGKILRDEKVGSYTQSFNAVTAEGAQL